MKGSGAVALVLSLVALALAALGFVTARRAAGPEAGAAISRGEIERLSGTLDEVSAQLKKLDARVAVLDEASKRPEPAPRLDREALRTLLDEEVRQYVARVGGTIPLPEKDLPQAVKDAALKAVPGIRITRAEQRTKRGRVVFDLEGRLGDEEYELRIAADGQVLRADLPPGQIPQAVKGAAQRTIAGIELTRARREIDDGLEMFELEGELAGREYELKISAAGDILEADLPPAQVPEAVREAAGKTIYGLEITWAAAYVDEGLVIYELEGKAGGREYDLEISADGRVIEAEIPVEELPQPVTQAAAAAFEGVKLTDAKQVTEDEGVFFEIEGRVGDAEVRIWASPNGEIRETEMAVSLLPQVVREAAEGAVKDIRLTEAGSEMDEGELVYGVGGRLGREEYWIVVSAGGEVLEIERGGEDEGGEDGGDEGDAPVPAPPGDDALF